VKSKWKEGREVLNLRQPLAQQQLNLRQPLAQQQADDEDEAAVPPETYVVITALDERAAARVMAAARQLTGSKRILLLGLSWQLRVL
jgi:hypothetical protein